MQSILSRDNPKLKTVRALIRSKKDRQAASAFVMEGVRALSALIDGSGSASYTLKEIWVSSDAVELAKGFSVPVYSIAHDVMEQLSDCCTSQGILGVVEYTPQPLEINQDKGNYLLVDHLMDPGNLGTLIRSAVAFGFDGVFLYGDTVEVFNPKTVRATMGALPFCRIHRLLPRESGASLATLGSKVWKLTASEHGALRSEGDVFSNDWKATALRHSALRSEGDVFSNDWKATALRHSASRSEGDVFSKDWKNGDEVFQWLEKAGYELIATVLHGGENLHEMKFGPKNVLVIGNEARGVSEAVQNRAARKLSIPMSGNTESLNAAVAGSICMFSMQRR